MGLTNFEGIEILFFGFKYMDYSHSSTHQPICPLPNFHLILMNIRILNAYF